MKKNSVYYYTNIILWNYKIIILYSFFFTNIYICYYLCITRNLIIHTKILQEKKILPVSNVSYVIYKI
jgi:hypothetical protein